MLLPALVSGRTTVASTGSGPDGPRSVRRAFRQGRTPESRSVVQRPALRWARLAILALLLGADGVPAEGNRPGDPTILRVGSQNLLHDFPKYHKVQQRLERVAEEIRRLDLDIVGFQESANITRVGHVPEKIAALLGYHYAYFRLEYAGFFFGFENGISIVSRYPILERELLTFRHQKNAFEARSVMRVLIETPLVRVNFYSAHLSGSTDTLNLEQIREVVSFIEAHRRDSPSILVGDFNFHRNESASLFLAGAGYVDTFASANPGRDNASCCTCIETSYSNWFDDCPETPFRNADDRVYLVPGRVMAGEVLAAGFMMASPFREGGGLLWGSDHKGVESHVRLAPRPTSEEKFAIAETP